MKDSFVELAAMVMLFLSVTALYWVFVLGPRDAALYEIMDCMGEDNSRGAYDECHKRLKPSRASPK